MTGDPDLDQACEDMAPAAFRLRQLQSLAADREQPYSSLTARKVELADAIDEFATRGERLCLHPDKRTAGRVLLIVVEEADRLRKKFRRRPTAVQLREAIRVAVEAKERDRIEAEAEFNLARLVAKDASYRAASTSAALKYLEACRAA